MRSIDLKFITISGLMDNKYQMHQSHKISNLGIFFLAIHNAMAL